MADTTRVAADLDSTIAALQQGLTSIPPDQALSVIDTWQQRLQGTDLAEDLGQLKDALANGGSSGALSSLLSDLGEDTGEVAANVPAEIATKLQQLSQLLQQAGRSLG